MTAFADRVDRLNAVIGRAVAWLALAVVLLQFVLVVARYLFGLGSIWLTETVIYAHAALFMLAAAWTLRAGGHVRVDIFYGEASARTKALIELIGAVLFLLPFMIVFHGYRSLMPRARGQSLNIRRRRAACRSCSC